MAREKFRKVRTHFSLSERRGNKPTSIYENDVSERHLFGPRFRFGWPINPFFADCVALRVAPFPFSFDFGFAFCTFLRKEAGERVNAPWREVNEPGVGLRTVNEGWVWKLGTTALYDWKLKGTPPLYMTWSGMKVGSSSG
jgi:hypothetical protein